MIYIVTFGFMALDYLSGLLKAVKNKNISSKKMREGLLHKCSLLLCMLLGVLIDYAQAMVDLGFNAYAPAAICGYIITMEIISIVENVIEVNPEIAPEKLIRLFGGGNRE